MIFVGTLYGVGALTLKTAGETFSQSARLIISNMCPLRLSQSQFSLGVVLPSNCYCLALIFLGVSTFTTSGGFAAIVLLATLDFADLLDLPWIPAALALPDLLPS